MSDETFVAVYDTPAHAELAVQDLLAAKVPQSAISRHTAEGSTSSLACRLLQQARGGEALSFNPAQRDQGTLIYAVCGIAAAKTSSTTSGLLAITSSSTRAAASGWRLPCSHSRTELVVKPNRLAKLAWLRVVESRIARTSTYAGTCQAQG